MATVEFRYDPKNTAWFTANAAMVLKAGEPAYHDTTGLFKLGDGVTALSALSFLPIVSTATPTIQQVLTAGQVATTTIETTGFIKTGGLATEFLKADGTVDSTVYGIGDALTTNPLSQFAATTSSQLAGVISDETGSGALVFGTSPTFTTNITTPLIYGSSASGGNLTLQSTSNATKGVIQVGSTDLVNIGNATTASQRLVRIGQDTSYIDIGSLVGATSFGALYFNQSTPSSTNFTILANATQTVFNGTTSLTLRLNNANAVNFTQTSTQFNIVAAASSGAVIPYSFASISNTNQTLSTNIPNFRISGANKQWATGTVANQYWNYLTANTASFVGASTLSESVALQIDAATAGTNATITNNFALGLLSGTSTIKMGNLTGSTTTPAIYLNQATPSATNYTINYVTGTGITNINSASEKLYFNTQGNIRFYISSSNGISETHFLFSPKGRTTLTASTEVPTIQLAASSSSFLTGALTTQRFTYLQSQTLSFSGASTATNVYGLFVEAATAGTNATITNNYSLGTNGKAKFGGNIELTQTVTTEALTSDTSVTIVINGVTYKLLAKA